LGATLQFEWDETKAIANKRRHHVSFEVAARVFLDPNRIEILDDREDYGEDRWITIGMVAPALLVVVYTLRGSEGDLVRLISARRANEQEQKGYRQFQS
jgi:hypothetical protein